MEVVIDDPPNVMVTFVEVATPVVMVKLLISSLDLSRCNIPKLDPLIAK